MNTMKSRFLMLSCLQLVGFYAWTQLKSGPMLGPVELKTAWIWCELDRDVEVYLEYWNDRDLHKKKAWPLEKAKRFEFKACKFYLTGLDFGTKYRYRLVVHGMHKNDWPQGSFTTQDLWQYRKPPPDFSFLAGSCAYFNDPVNDRPGKPYGGDSSIFVTMASEPAAFMLWLGDNWYYREVDYYSNWGLWNRASQCRSSKEMQDFWKATSHIAIWDDHDYGTNNSGSEYVFKKESANVFNQYWCNPPCPSNEGIYTRYTYNDVDLFLMDDRTFRWSDDVKDSLDGKINLQKVMWGETQLKWLKNELANSRAAFKIIANGSNVLNPYNKHDCLVHYPGEYHELLRFIEQERINGILFMTGDRHHSEVVRMKLKDGYYTYDVTNSSLTSGIYKLDDLEKSNPDLIQHMLVEQNNYTRATISGPRNDRKLKIEFVDGKGKSLANMELLQKELMFPK